MSESVTEGTGAKGFDSSSQTSERGVLLEFISKLGLAMTGTGQSIDVIQTSLAKIANAYRVKAQVAVLPNILLIKLGGHGSAEVDLASGVNQPYRLDQTADVFHLVGRAERAEVSPNEGLRRLAEIRRTPSRYNPATRILGYAGIAVGIGLILEGSLSQLLTCILLGVLIGELKELCSNNRTAASLVPVISSLVVGIVVFSIVKADLVSGPLMLLIPPVVTFLPGATLTTALIELANGDIISGASRLVDGAIKLLLLIFGYIVAAGLIGLPTAEAFAQEPRPVFGWWAPWLGVFIYGIGTYIHHTAPTRSLPWLFLVLYVAFAGQQIGGQTLGGYLSGFIGAVAMTPVAYWIERRPGAPPALVTFLPGFWLLVPGSLGLIGLAQLAADNGQAGVQTVGDMTFALVAVALGVMVGTQLIRPIGKPLGEVPERVERGLGRLIGKGMIVATTIRKSAKQEIESAKTQSADGSMTGEDYSEPTDSSSQTRNGSAEW